MSLVPPIHILHTQPVPQAAAASVLTHIRDAIARRLQWCALGSNPAMDYTYKISSIRIRMMYDTSGRVMAINSWEHQCAVVNQKCRVAPVYLAPAETQP